MESTFLELIPIFERAGVYLTDNEIDAQLDIDSIEFISIIVAIEESFDIEIPDDYLLFDNLNTPRKFINLIESIRNEVR